MNIFNKLFGEEFTKEQMDVLHDYMELKKIISSFNDGDVKPINRNDLEQFPLMEWQEINDKVRVRKRQNRFKNYLNFDTEMKEGGEFGTHFHGDMIESCEVLMGELIDLEDGKIYKKGDVLHYDNGVKHTVMANENSFLNVLFK